MSRYEHYEGCLAIYTPPLDLETVYREGRTSPEHRMVPGRNEMVRIVAREPRLGGPASVIENFDEENPRFYVDGLDGRSYRAVPMRHLRFWA